MAHKTSKEMHRTYTPYADTDVLQTLCADNAFKVSAHERNVQLKKNICAYIFDSLDLWL